MSNGGFSFGAAKPGGTAAAGFKLGGAAAPATGGFAAKPGAGGGGFSFAAKPAGDAAGGGTAGLAKPAAPKAAVAFGQPPAAGTTAAAAAKPAAAGAFGGFGGAKPAAAAGGGATPAAAGGGAAPKLTFAANLGAATAGAAAPAGGAATIGQGVGAVAQAPALLSQTSKIDNKPLNAIYADWEQVRRGSLEAAVAMPQKTLESERAAHARTRTHTHGRTHAPLLWSGSHSDTPSIFSTTFLIDDEHPPHIIPVTSSSSSSLIVVGRQGQRSKGGRSGRCNKVQPEGARAGHAAVGGCCRSTSLLMQHYGCGWIIRNKMGGI
eukprot:SAG22_NODE_539_length_9317_cov_4.771209_2_plen_321_part_00